MRRHVAKVSNCIGGGFGGEQILRLLHGVRCLRGHQFELLRLLDRLISVGVGGICLELLLLEMVRPLLIKITL